MDSNKDRVEETRLEERVSLFKEAAPTEDLIGKAAMLEARAKLIEARAKLMDSRYHRQLFYHAIYIHPEVDELHTKLCEEEEAYGDLPICLKLKRLEKELPKLFEDMRDHFQLNYKLDDAHNSTL